MNYSTIKNCDVANGIGCRVTLFVSGCTNRCEGCFQPETWDFCYGEPYTAETEAYLFSLLAPAYIRGLTLLGGDPMEPSNQRALVGLLRRVRAELPEKDIWCYSGFTLEELQREGSHPRCDVTDEMLSLLDVLVDGRFVQALKDPSLWFRGSSNQRILNMPETLRQKKPVLLPARDRKSSPLKE